MTLVEAQLFAGQYQHWASRAKTNDSGWRWAPGLPPHPVPPYGDFPEDQAKIAAGYADAMRDMAEIRRRCKGGLSQSRSCFDAGRDDWIRREMERQGRIR